MFRVVRRTYVVVVRSDEMLCGGQNARCRRYMSDLSNVTPRYLGSGQKGKVSLLWLTLSSRLASLLLRWTTWLYF